MLGIKNAIIVLEPTTALCNSMLHVCVFGEQINYCPSLISIYDVLLDDNQIIGNKLGAHILYLIFMYLHICELEIKPCGRGSRIRDMETESHN